MPLFLRVQRCFAHPANFYLVVLILPGALQRVPPLSASKLRKTNQQFAGRSDKRRIKYGHQSVPKGTYTCKMLPAA